MISMNDQTHVKGRSGSIDHVPALLAHLRLEWLLQHFPTRVVWAIYVCINGFITIGLLALLALLRAAPLSFHRSAQLRIYSFFLLWRRPRVRVIPSSVTQSDSSVVMPPLRLL